jgi:hypothetical protein
VPVTSRIDMHCHSTASHFSKLGVQRSLGLPECATPPEAVHVLAKRRGMDFVTITDHDTIDGCLELADRPDCFVSEELTARFAGELQAVQVLCYGITPGDHEWLQAHSGDVEACAACLFEHGIACALAHPYFHVAAPLTRRHRRMLAELFPIWEVRNGSRAAELAEAQSEQGSAAKWAHAAMALATRALTESAELPISCANRDKEATRRGPVPGAVLKMAEAAARAARERSWERSMAKLGAGYRQALEAAAPAASQSLARAA